MARKRWNEVSGPARSALVAASAAQVLLAAGAWCDLARRPTAAVRGSKPVWALVIAINFVGPVAYLRFGRKPHDEPIRLAE